MATIPSRGRGKVRGGSRGTHTSKQQVRTATPTSTSTTDKDTPSMPPSPVFSNPFAPTMTPFVFGAPLATSSPFGAPTTVAVNPFASNTSEAPKNPFSATNNSFRAPSQSSTSTIAFGNPFGAPSQPSQSSATTSAFGKPAGLPAATSNPPTTTSVFGRPSGIAAVTPDPSTTTSAFVNPFGAPPQPSQSSNATNAFGKSSGLPAATSNPPKTTSTFGKPSGPPAATSSPSISTNTNPFGKPPQSGAPGKAPRPNLKPTPSGAKSNINGFGSQPTPTTKSKPTRPKSPPATSSAFATTIDQLLRKQNILPPSWPTSTPGDPNQKTALHAFWQTYKTYRMKVRATIIRAGLLDDPDKPKKLSEAIDFKGTCEDMCPEFERLTRIVERDVQNAEKELGSDGGLWPAPEKMVKKLARSAAGQDAPLPMDVRSPAALRKTLDYLLHTVLGEDGDLVAVHGYLWDRTRAIRRDFIFQSSMSQAELYDQIYCLERITRFHVVALHQMSQEVVVADDFSEQQEIEQLGKSLLSLIHVYEDCQSQGINCENEAEFRAYYVLFNSHNSGILETVQDWGWKFWGESDQIKIAVSLVETLQNIWDTRGPLKPYAATDIAQNGYSRFFSIIEDKKVSYTMACFAEIHFNGIRKAALKAILTAYRKQRDQTKDWTLTKLNDYLRFDEEEDIVEFGEAYGLQFQENDGETYLSIESDEPSDPFPPFKQRHSYSLVERKRGDRSLPAVIDSTVYDEGEEISEEASDEDSLFVKETAAKGKAKITPTTTGQEDLEESSPEDVVSIKPTSSLQTPTSIFNQPMSQPTFGSSLFTPKSSEPSPTISTSNQPQPTFGDNFFTSKPAESSAATQSQTPQDSSSSPSKLPAQAAPSIFAPFKQPQTAPTPSFSFLNQPVTQPTTGSIQLPSSSQPLAFGSGLPPPESPKSLFQPVVGATASSESPKPSFSLGQQSTAAGPSLQGPTPPLSLGGYSVTPPKPYVENVRECSSSHSTPQQALPQSSLGVGSTFSTAPQPTFNSTPIPQSIPETGARGSDSLGAAKALAVEKRKAQFDNLTKWVFIGDDGIMDQFTEHLVGNILQNAVDIHQREEAERKAKAEVARNRALADDFRYRSLAVKYGQMWRAEAHRMWMRRKGREARKARQEMAESLRASRTLQSANVVEDFRASTNSSRRGSLESLLDATGVLDGVHHPNNEIRAIVEREEPQALSKQRNPGRSTNSPASSTNGHRRGKSDNPLRRSLLSDPTYLYGGSRIHLMSKYDARDEARRQVSGVQTDYFRLKARGISTLPDGTPLANSAANDIPHQKRSFDEKPKLSTPQKSLMPPPAARSVPAKQSEVTWKGGDSSEVIQAMKARARALVEDDRPKKRSFDADEELFARAKRVREQMDEGSEWYSKQIGRDTASRSVS